MPRPLRKVGLKLGPARWRGATSATAALSRREPTDVPCATREHILWFAPGHGPTRPSGASSPVRLKSVWVFTRSTLCLSALRCKTSQLQGGRAGAETCGSCVRERCLILALLCGGAATHHLRSGQKETFSQSSYRKNSCDASQPFLKI